MAVTGKKLSELASEGQITLMPSYIYGELDGVSKAVAGVGSVYNGAGVLPASRATAGFAITANYHGYGEVNFWNLVNNTDASNEGWYFEQKTGAGTSRTVASLITLSAVSALTLIAPDAVTEGGIYAINSSIDFGTRSAVPMRLITSDLERMRIAADGTASFVADGFGLIPPTQPLGFAITNNYYGDGEVDLWSLANDTGFNFFQKTAATTVKAVGALYGGSAWSEFDVLGPDGWDGNYFSAYVDPDQVGLAAGTGKPLHFYGDDFIQVMTIKPNGIVSVNADNLGQMPPSQPFGLGITNNYEGYGEVNFWNLVNNTVDAEGFYFRQKTGAATQKTIAALFSDPTYSGLEVIHQPTGTTGPTDNWLGLYTNPTASTIETGMDLQFHTNGVNRLTIGETGIISALSDTLGIIPPSQPTAGLAITNNYIGCGEVDFWNLVNNEDTNNEGFYFYQKTAAGAAKDIAYLYSYSSGSAFSVKGAARIISLVAEAAEVYVSSTGGVPLNFYVGNVGDIKAMSLVGGGLSVFGANAQSTNSLVLSELTTIAAAASSNTVIQIPARSMVLGVSVRVTAAIPTAASFTVGVAGAAARYGTAIPVALNTTFGSPPTDNVFYYAAATALVITPNLTPGTNVGRVRVTIHYTTLTPPTS